MSYFGRENGYRGGATIGITAIVLVLGARYAFKMLLPVFGMGPAPALPEIHRSLLSDPISGALFRTIDATFPSDLKRLEGDIQSRLKHDQGPKEISAATWAFVADLRYRHLGDLAQAPHDNLTELLGAEIDLINTLHEESPPLCAKFGGSNITLAEMPEGRPRELMTSFVVAQWRAMAAGRDTPAGRARGPLTPADQEAVAKALRRDGISQLEFEAFAREQIGDASVDIGCGVTYHLIRAVSALPGEQRDRVFATMLAGGTS